MSKSMINFNYTKEKRIAWIVTGKQAKPILSRYLGRDIDLRLVFFIIDVESERYGALGMRIDRVINNNVVSAIRKWNSRERVTDRSLSAAAVIRKN